MWETWYGESWEQPRLLQPSVWLLSTQHPSLPIPHSELQCGGLEISVMLLRSELYEQVQTDSLEKGLGKQCRTQTGNYSYFHPHMPPATSVSWFVNKKTFKFLLCLPFHYYRQAVSYHLLLWDYFSTPCLPVFASYSSSKPPSCGFPKIPAMCLFHRSGHSTKRADSFLPPEDALVLICCSSFSFAHLPL